MANEAWSTPPTLLEEQGQLTRSRIRRAAMAVVADRGFDATVEEIAQLSGVSPRTIFRHYTNHASLIASTVKDMLDACAAPIEGLPLPEDDFDGWLEALAVAVHTRTAQIVGRAFWHLHDPSRAGSAVLGEVAALQHEFRLQGVRYLVGAAWRALDGQGEPPHELVLAFALNLSTFATQALLIDFDQTPAQIGALTADILNVLLRRARHAQCARTGGVGMATEIVNS